MMNQLDAQTFVPFATAGRAIFTVVSPTGARFTFRVQAPRKQGARRTLFVHVRTGGERGWSYLGMIGDRGFMHTTKSPASSDPAFMAFGWLWSMATSGRAWPPSLVILHEGECGKCGRPLTDPESIRTGLGPVCSGSKRAGKIRVVVRAAA